MERVGKLKVLVVDDEPNVCDCIRLLLAMEGHDVKTADSGRSALAIFRKNRFDMVFTDYSMPGMKGDELARQIKAIAPEQPVAMVTGLAATMEQPDGVDYLIAKPFALEDLRKALLHLSPVTPS
jgi:CheY-like chemotaxis protein